MKSSATRIKRHTANFTSIRIPRATSTISASFMQYTVFIVGVLKERNNVTAGEESLKSYDKEENESKVTFPLPSHQR
jgi:hypothetical protein